jgi:hypothetical protein
MKQEFMKRRKAVFVGCGFLLGIAVFCLVANTFQIWGISDLPRNLVGALLSSLVTVIITALLLQMQTEQQQELLGKQLAEQTKAESNKERFSVLFKEKARTYEAFLTKLRDVVVGDNEFTPEEAQNLADDLNFKLSMYLDSSVPDEEPPENRIGDLINKMYQVRDRPVEVKEYAQKIIYILRKDLNAKV